MMTADDYGNSGAYFNNSSNASTARYLGLSSSVGNIGRSRVAAYSNIREGGTGIALTTRFARAGSAIPGWQGPRPIAFTMVPEWNFDTPTT